MALTMSMSGPFRALRLPGLAPALALAPPTPTRSFLPSRLLRPRHPVSPPPRGPRPSFTSSRGCRGPGPCRGIITGRAAAAADSDGPAERSPTGPRWDWLQDKRVLIITPVWPEKTTTAAALRTWSLVEMLTKKVRGAQTMLVSPARDARGAVENLESYGVRTERVQPNDEAFDALLLDFQPDVTIFDRFTMEEMFGWRVAAKIPSCLRVLDTQDLHFLRHQRQTRIESLKVSNQDYDPERSRLQNESRKDEGLDRAFWSPVTVADEGSRLDLRCDRLTRELASIHRSDLTLLVSPFERELLSSKFDVSPQRLVLAPFFYDLDSDKASEELTGRSRDFVSIGNFRHPPNMDSVEWLKYEVWPAIRSELKNPEQHLLRVYGAFPPASAMALTSTEEGFIVEGPAKCQYTTLRSHRCLVAPLRFGAGIKGKIADAWSVGTPVVTTYIGAEGMHPDDWNIDACRFGGKVAYSLAAFARAAADLVEDDDAFAKASAEARLCVQEMFDADKGSQRLLSALDSAGRNLHAQRQQDWLQAVLLDDFHRSTEYKSRYIETVAELRNLRGTLEELQSKLDSTAASEEDNSTPRV